MSFNSSIVEHTQQNYINSEPETKEPIISFSPDRCRFDTKIAHVSNHTDVISHLLREPSSSENLSKNNFKNSNLPKDQEIQLFDVIGDSHSNQHSLDQNIGSNFQVCASSWNQMEYLNNKLPESILNSENFESIKLSNSEAEMSQLELESPPENSSTMHDHIVLGTHEITTIPRTTELVAAQNFSSITSNTYSSAFDIKKVPSLLPPQRLAIPQKSNNATTTGSTSSKPQEFKPLVQWDSDERFADMPGLHFKRAYFIIFSEEELSFFPAPKNRSALTDNLSIDNMSLSGEEDDLHLSPPSRTTSRCPCDPRLLIDSKFTKSASTSASKKLQFQKQCTIS